MGTCAIGEKFQQYNNEVYIFNCLFFCFFNVVFTLEKTVIAKSSLLIDVKPWDDETGMVCRVMLHVFQKGLAPSGMFWGILISLWITTISPDFSHALLIVRNIFPVEKSVPQWQKLHTDDVKLICPESCQVFSVVEKILYSFCYCFWMTERTT